LIYNLHDRPDGVARLTLHRSTFGFEINYTSRPLELECLIERGCLIANPVSLEQLVPDLHPRRFFRNAKTLLQRSDTAEGRRRYQKSKELAAADRVNAPAPASDATFPVAPWVQTAPCHPPVPDLNWGTVRAAIDVLNRALVADPALDLTLTDRRLRVVYG
jgi:hypothetical protein